MPSASTAAPAPDAASVATDAGSGAARVVHVEPTDAAWIARLPRGKPFRQVHLVGTTLVRVSWVQHEQRRLRDLPSDQDFPGNYASAIELVLSGEADTVRLDLGTHSGGIEALGVTACERRGYRVPPDSAWSFPHIPGLVSSFGVTIPQGGSDWMIVLAGDSLHVLARDTSDGTCESMIQQGPIATCKGEPYTRRAEVRLRGKPAFEEDVVVGANSAGAGEPWDCAEAWMDGSHLLPP
jgi:hypothetical protein